MKAAMMEPRKIAMMIIIENMVLTLRWLQLDCGVEESPVNIYSKSKSIYTICQNLKFWSGVMSKFSGQLALC